MSRYSKSEYGNSKPGEGTDPGTPARLKSYKGIAIPELPIIDSTMAQTFSTSETPPFGTVRELGLISGIFVDGKYENTRLRSTVYDPE